MAEGLLLLCLGRATKVVRFLAALDKTYCAEIRLGGRTTTGDATGRLYDTADTAQLTMARVEEVLSRYRGIIQQRVPNHSAVKVAGRRLYAYARRGGDVPQVVREVEIHDLILESFANPDLTITVRCSGGTYIRALARDIGEDLGCGGFLTSLSRTKIGDHGCAGAEKLDELESLSSLDDCLARVRPFEDYLPFPRVVIGDEEVADISNGRHFSPRAVKDFAAGFARGDRILLCDPQRHGIAVAVAERDSAALAGYAGTDWFRYERVLN